jgi:hypothetical protein
VADTDKGQLMVEMVQADTAEKFESFSLSRRSAFRSALARQARELTILIAQPQGINPLDVSAHDRRGALSRNEQLWGWSQTSLGSCRRNVSICGPPDRRSTRT